MKKEIDIESMRKAIEEAVGMPLDELQKAESLNGARSMTFNGPVGQVIANVEEINTTTDK